MSIYFIIQPKRENTTIDCKGSFSNVGRHKSITANKIMVIMAQP